MVRNSWTIVYALGIAICLFYSSVQAQNVFGTGLVQTFGSGFSDPVGVVLDSDGNLFVADCNSNSIKEIAAVGGSIPASPTTSTVINLPDCPRGIAMDAHRNLFAVVNSAVLEIPYGSHSYNLVPQSSPMSSPYGVAVDASGDVFVADAGNQCVEEIVAVNGSVRSFGKGTMGRVTDVAIDLSGDVFVADPQSTGVWEIIAANGVIPAMPTIKNINIYTGSDRFSGVAVDAGGDLFVTEAETGFLKEYLASPGGLYLTTIQSVENNLNNPGGVAIDSHGRIYVADSGHNSIVQITQPPLFLGSVNVGATSSVFSVSFGYYASDDPPGPIYIENVDSYHPDYIDAGTSTCKANVNTYAKNTCTVNILFTPSGPGLRQGAVYIQDGLATQLALVNLNGEGMSPPAQIGPTLSALSNIAADTGGNVFFSDSANHTVSELLAAGGYTTVQPLGVTLNSPGPIAVDNAENVYVVDVQGNATRVKEILATGGYRTVRTLTQVDSCVGLAVDGQGSVYVANFKDQEVTKIVAVNGSIPDSPAITQIGQFNYPAAIAVDYFGNVVVWEEFGNLLEGAMAKEGYAHIRTIAPAYVVAGLSLDNNGNIFVANGGTIEELVPNGAYFDKLVLANGLLAPMALTRDLPGNLYIGISPGSVPLSYRILKLSQ